MPKPGHLCRTVRDLALFCMAPDSALHGVNGCIMLCPMHGNVPFATNDARYGRFCRLDARLDGRLDAQHGRFGPGRTEARTMCWVHVRRPLCVWDKAEGVVWADNMTVF